MKRWIYCFLVSTAIAQQPASEQLNLPVLEGHVIHGVSREPVRKARVTLELSGVEHDSAYVATTDSAGHFRFADIKPGTYKLVVSKTGFLTGEYGADKPEGEGSLLKVSSGNLVSNLTLRLFPGGVISGRILDADGDPAPSNQVVLWNQERSRKKTIASHAQETTTDGTGEYRFEGLSAGTYYISADTGEWGNATHQILVNSEGKSTKIHDLTTFYPVALSLAESQPIRLQNGQEQAGIDIRIQRGPTFSVKGKIAQVGDSLSNYFLSATVDQGIGWTPERGEILPTGEFVFRALPPGKHHLYLLSQGGHGAQMEGQTEVNVTDQDVTGVMITPFKSAQVRVRVIQEDERDHPLTAGSVFLMLADENENDGNQISRNQAQFAPQGGFYLFPSVIPGQYHVWLNNATGCYLKSIQAGGQKLNTNKVDVAEASNLDILLTFSKNVAAVRGEVEMPQDQVTHSAHVVLVAEDPSLHLNKIFYASPDQFFHFAKENIPPGRYNAFATEDALDLWDNTEFVKLLESKAAHVELQEKQQAVLHLKLVSKEETDRVRRQMGL